MRWLGPIAGASAAALAGFYYAFQFERGWLDITYHPTEIENLPTEWDGFRVAFLSDLHIEQDTAHVKALEQAVERIISEKPDLVALGGDYSDHGKWNKNLTEILSPLKKANLPLVAVLGNHDYHSGMRGRQEIIEGLRDLGATVLIDEACPITYKGVTQWVLGIDDMSKGWGDYQKAAATIPDGHRPFLMLTHSPMFMDEVPPNCVDFALSGHMHGGQINFAPPPFQERWNWVKWDIAGNNFSPYAQGWYKARGNQFYVGRGLGVTKYPVRFGSRPELPIFELHPAKA